MAYVGKLYRNGRIKYKREASQSLEAEDEDDAGERWAFCVNWEVWKQIKNLSYPTHKLDIFRQNSNVAMDALQSSASPTTIP